MSRFITLTASVIAVVLLATTPASAKSVAEIRYPHTKAAVKYSAFWHKAHQKCGRCSGRNIRKWGMRFSSGRVERASYRQIARSTSQLRRLTAPPPAPRRLLRRVAVPPRQRPAGVASSAVEGTYGGGWAIPSYIVQCESGGNWNAHNPSGATGPYQIMPGTASAYGCDLSTREGHHRCAARIYAAEGASPWVCG